MPRRWVDSHPPCRQRSISGLSPTTAIKHTVFANGGRDLFVASNTGLLFVDTFDEQPVAVTLAPGSWSSVAWDRVHRRAYSLDSQSLVVVEGSRTSPAFGTIVAQTATGGDASVAISADGTTMALGSPTGMTRRDANPASPGYLGLIPTPPTPLQIPPLLSSSVGAVHVSPDGRVVSVPFHTLFPAPGLTVIHRFDTLAGAWIDHDPVAPGYQPFGQAAYPALDQYFNHNWTRDGSALVILGYGSSFTRFEVDLASPANFTVTSTTTIAPELGTIPVSLTASGRFLLRQHYDIFVTPSPVTLSFMEIATGWTTPWVTLPAAPNHSQFALAAWR